MSKLCKTKYFIIFFTSFIVPAFTQANGMGTLYFAVIPLFFLITSILISSFIYVSLRVIFKISSIKSIFTAIISYIFLIPLFWFIAGFLFIKPYGPKTIQAIIALNFPLIVVIIVVFFSILYLIFKIFLRRPLKSVVLGLIMFIPVLFILFFFVYFMLGV